MGRSWYGSPALPSYARRRIRWVCIALSEGSVHICHTLTLFRHFVQRLCFSVRPELPKDVASCTDAVGNRRKGGKNKKDDASSFEEILFRLGVAKDVGADVLIEHVTRSAQLIAGWVKDINAARRVRLNHRPI